MLLRGMFHEASNAISANRLRTLLTMLGMVIGVGAVVLMISIGQGAQFAVKQSIDSIGSNLFIVMSGGATTGGVRTGMGNAPTLTLADAAAIRELPGIVAVAPLHMGAAQIVYGAQNWNTSVYGSTPDFHEVRSWPVASGVSFTDSDLRSASRVALIGQSVAENLFPNEDPVGKTLRIRQSPYQILGVLAAKGQSPDGQDQDDSVMIPITTAQRKLFGSPFPGTVRFVGVKAESAEAMPKLEADINALLAQRHRIREGQENDFTVKNLSDIVEIAVETTRVMSLLLGAIASISLIVGGIGIMNIMLVSVTERTREIGIRMAIGAREQDVLMQFLLEAILISAVGCLIGLVLGIGGAMAANMLAGVPVVISGGTVLIAFGVAAATGIFFGFYPARKAARLDPIEALRYQ
ncbi:MAG: ABC transporter permease [Zoogloeaceae bacterium]|jgi:putative ABC transport system permease protein|nr:ABC transporter permease [Zoogloeaceae bacterium]